MNQHTFDVYTLFQANATYRPLEKAVLDNGRTITFQELFDKANALAGWMAVQGLKQGDRVAVLAMNRYEYLAVYGAAAALGAVAVPLNWRLSQAELSFILNDSGASLLFFDFAFESKALALCAAAGLENNKILARNMSDIPRAGTTVPGVPSQPGPSGPDSLFCLIYTAAVQGHPRGAALSHGNIIAANLQTSLAMAITASDSYLNMLPLCHITGINLALSVMHMGGTNVIMDKFDAAMALEMIQAHSVTLLASFPPILSMIMEAMGNERAPDMAGIRIAGIDSPDTIQQFTQKTGSRFWVFYGQSETTGFVSLADSADAPGSAGAVGCISPLSIQDAAGRNLDTGQSGEICVRGPMVFQGYWSPNGIDTASFRNGWHHTGDRGRLDEDGFLWFEGRNPEKELIKPGGENVYPAEVEAVILGHPEITEACVIGVPDPKFGEGIKAVCVRTPGSGLTGDQLIAFVADRIARYKKPGYVDFADALPKTRDGRIDRILVKERHGA